MSNNIVKVIISYTDGTYFASKVSQETSEHLNNNICNIAEIPEDKYDQWIKFLDQSKEWNSYWRELDNEWYDTRYKK